MIASNSRYAQSSVIVGNDFAGKDIQIIVAGIQGSYSFGFEFYQLKERDTLPDLANQAYGDPSLWWVIADANPEILLWDVLPTAKIIRVPVNANV